MSSWLTLFSRTPWIITRKSIDQNTTSVYTDTSTSMYQHDQEALSPMSIGTGRRRSWWRFGFSLIGLVVLVATLNSFPAKLCQGQTSVSPSEKNLTKINSVTYLSGFLAVISGIILWVLLSRYKIYRDYVDRCYYLLASWRRSTESTAHVIQPLRNKIENQIKGVDNPNIWEGESRELFHELTNSYQYLTSLVAASLFVQAEGERAIRESSFWNFSSLIQMIDLFERDSFHLDGKRCADILGLKDSRLLATMSENYYFSANQIAQDVQLVGDNVHELLIKFSRMWEGSLQLKLQLERFLNTIKEIQSVWPENWTDHPILKTLRLTQQRLENNLNVEDPFHLVRNSRFLFEEVESSILQGQDVIRLRNELQQLKIQLEAYIDDWQVSEKVWITLSLGQSESQSCHYQPLYKDLDIDKAFQYVQKLLSSAQSDLSRADLDAVRSTVSKLEERLALLGRVLEESLSAKSTVETYYPKIRSQTHQAVQLSTSSYDNDYRYFLVMVEELYFQQRFLEAYDLFQMLITDLNGREP